LPFLEGIGRPVRDNAIDVYLSENSDEILSEGAWQNVFSLRPEPLTASEKRSYLDGVRGVALGSDAFFPFEDNIRRAAASGVSYIAQPGGSIRDPRVIDASNALGMVMCFTGLRLFHH
jgi:AICAR transformylase/IMP cyclohydrolase PurH